VHISIFISFSACSIPLASSLIPFSFSLYSLSHFSFFTSTSSESKSTKAKAPRSSTRRKANSLPKTKPPSEHHHYLVVDTTLPSHIFSDRSLFTTYIPSRQLHRTVFGTNIVIEGVGDVQVHVVIGSKSILFRFRDSWHVPSSPHHFLSASRAISLGNQIMIANCSPRMIFSHQKRLVKPDLPKYMPFTRLDSFIVLKFNIPAQVSLQVSPQSAFKLPTGTTQSANNTVPSYSLQASSYSSCPFAGLSINQCLLPSPSSSLVTLDAPLVVDRDTHTLNGGADVLMDMDMSVALSNDSDVIVISHEGADVHVTTDVKVNSILYGGAEVQDADQCWGDGQMHRNGVFEYNGGMLSNTEFSWVDGRLGACFSHCLLGHWYFGLQVTTTSSYGLR
jgi:hypothetical protein